MRMNDERGVTSASMQSHSAAALLRDGSDCRGQSSKGPSGLQDASSVVVLHIIVFLTCIEPSRCAWNPALTRKACPLCVGAGRLHSWRAQGIAAHAHLMGGYASRVGLCPLHTCLHCFDVEPAC